MAWAKQTKVGDATRKAILLVLADYADEEGSCYPSQETIALEAETSERTVRRTLAKFEELGIIERKPRYLSGGRTSDRIFLQLDWQATPTLPLGLPANLTGGQSDRRSDEGGIPAKSGGSTGQSLAGEPLEEPLEEPPEQSSVVEDADVLCDFLARGITHHGHHAPKISAAWRRDMDLLLRRGPTEWREPTPIPAAEVRDTIRLLFTRLTVRSNSGFCWADQVGSAAALRRHWVKISAELRKPGTPDGISEARRMHDLFREEDDEGAA